MCYYGLCYNRKLDSINAYPKKVTRFTCFRTMICHQSTVYCRKLFEEKNYDTSYKILADREYLMWIVCSKRISPCYLDFLIVNYQADGACENEKYREQNKKDIQRMNETYLSNFEQTKFKSGEIYAWLNSDDMYMPWACELVAIVMEKTGIQWCTGIPCHYNERGVAHNVPRITPVFPRNFIRKGYMDGRVATFLEQESMFWSKNLWDKAGHVLVQYKTAGDYHLWKEFAKYEALYTLDSVISGFRIHAGQKSGDRNKYYAEVGENSLWERLLSGGFLCAWKFQDWQPQCALLHRCAGSGYS